MAHRSVRRNELIHEMERLYIDRAYSDSELAERLGVNRSTVYRTRVFMENELHLPFLSEAPGRYRLDRQKQLGSIRLSQLEALALYLGGRRLQQQTRIAHLPTAAALEKLAIVLRQPMMNNLVRAAQEVLEQEADPQQAHNLEQIVEGWISGRKVRVRYLKPHAETARVHMISPYQIEPSVWGDSVYLIGHSDHYDAVITLKSDGTMSVTGKLFGEEAKKNLGGKWTQDGETITFIDRLGCFLRSECSADLPTGLLAVAATDEDASARRPLVADAAGMTVIPIATAALTATKARPPCPFHESSIAPPEDESVQGRTAPRRRVPPQWEGC